MERNFYSCKEFLIITGEFMIKINFYIHVFQ